VLAESNQGASKRASVTPICGSTAAAPVVRAGAGQQSRGDCLQGWQRLIRQHVAEDVLTGRIRGERHPGHKRHRRSDHLRSQRGQRAASHCSVARFALTGRP
jgi:hypothetical protein